MVLIGYQQKINVHDARNDLRLPVETYKTNSQKWIQYVILYTYAF